jgi:hypothetical protein
MVRQPKNLAEAKQIFREEKTKVTSSVAKVAGSRWLMAILATFAIAFGTHLAYAPSRLPPVSGLSIAQIGFPTDLDFGVAGEQAREAARAARDQDVFGRIADILSANPELTNAVGFGLALVLLLVNMTVMTKRRRVSRG